MPTPTELLDRAQGRSLTDIAKTGIGGWLLAVSVSTIAGIQTVFEFLFLPFTLFIDVLDESVTNFLIVPLRLVPAGVSDTIAELSAFGIASGPVAVILAIVMIVIAIGATSLGMTGNVIVGSIIDNPLVSFFTTTPEEESEDD